MLPLVCMIVSRKCFGSGHQRRSAVYICRTLLFPRDAPRPASLPPPSPGRDQAPTLGLSLGHADPGGIYRLLGSRSLLLHFLMECRACSEVVEADQTGSSLEDHSTWSEDEHRRCWRVRKTTLSGATSKRKIASAASAGAPDDQHTPAFGHRCRSHLDSMQARWSPSNHSQRTR